MRTRNAGKPKPKPEAPPKKTPPSRRSSAKAVSNPPPEDDVTTSELVEQANSSADVMEVTPETKVTRGKRRSSSRKTPVKTKTPTSAKTPSRKTRKSEATPEREVEESPEKDEESVQKEETSENVAGESTKNAETEKEGESSKNEEAAPEIVEHVENIEVTDHRDGESSKKEEASEVIAEESEIVEHVENIEVTDHRDGESSKKEEASEVIAEESEIVEHVENIEVTDHRDGESSKKEEASEVIAEESEIVEHVENIEVTDHRDGESSKKEEASEVIAEESLVNIEPVITNIEVNDNAGTEPVIDVEETSKVEEKICDIEISSGQVEEDENDDDPEEDDDPQQGAKITDIEQTQDQSVMDAEEPLNIEEKSLEREANVDQGVMNPEEEPLKTDEDAMDTEQHLDQSVMDIEVSLKKEEKTIEKEETLDQIVTNPKELSKPDEDTDENQQKLVSKDGEAASQKEDREEVGMGKEKVKKESDNEPANMEEDVMDEDINQKAEEADPKVVDDSKGKDVVEKLEEREDAAEALEVERMELNNAAKERKMRKELEIFVGGLDRDATEDDVKKAFENVGEITKIRLLKDSSNANKGYAFVKFAAKELASKALLEMKNPLIRGKLCRTAASEDNDMLFLGNICNTWTKEAIKQKLKDYGIDNVENINLITDARQEGLSRGFAFLEFSCHADAMSAYKRLQKPDVIFGHRERTAKVAFAEPVREPDPEVMAQVKSVFVDGLNPQWNEEKVREKLKGCGEIVRITLARNMSTAKRRDFGFVDFATHEDALACIEGINGKDFDEGSSKGKVRARLSNPLPKTQVVKGGMCGGFKIGQGGGATSSSSRPGRGSGFVGHEFNRPNFQRDRGFVQRGRGQTGRVGFTREREAHMQFPPFQRREMFGRGGWRDHFRPAHDNFATAPAPLGPHLDMTRHDGAYNRSYERHIPNSRLPFRPEEVYTGPVMGRQMEDPYFYVGGTHGIKRPFSMTDQEPDYMDRSRLRPRIDYSDPAVPYRAPSYRGSFVPDRNLPSHDYYGPDYRGGPRPPFNGNARPYGGGYPPRY